MHGDIEPSNVRFTSDGSPKLLDFGLARETATSPPRASVLTALPPALIVCVLGAGGSVKDSRNLVGRAVPQRDEWRHIIVRLTPARILDVQLSGVGIPTVPIEQSPRVTI